MRNSIRCWGTVIRGLMRGMTTPQGNQKLLMVRQSWKTPGELGVQASPWNVIFSLQCFDTVGWVTGRALGL